MLSMRSTPRSAIPQLHRVVAQARPVDRIDRRHGDHNTVLHFRQEIVLSLFIRGGEPRALSWHENRRPLRETAMVSDFPEVGRIGEGFSRSNPNGRASYFIEVTVFSGSDSGSAQRA